MFDFCENNFKDIKFFFIESSDVKDKENFLESRFEQSLTIVGTQKMHKFIPLNNGKIKVFETSHADEGDEKQILK